LEERREIVNGSPEIIRYSETFAAPAAALIQVVRENGLEGIVAKRAGSTYRSGRSGDWVKWRANHGQEFVIGGYVPASSTFESLLVGYYDGERFIYAGRIRSGLVAHFRLSLFPHFAKLQIESCPSGTSPSGPRADGVKGLRPKTWTSAAG
jgi:bifunctional non-homologous end joining protein LigD